MRPIPAKDRKILASFDQICAKCFTKGVQWHHPFTYAGHQITNWWATVFACPKCHAKATPHNNKYDETVRDYFEWLLLKPFLISFCTFYPRGTWIQRFNYLNKKYGTISIRRNAPEREPNLQERSRKDYLSKRKST